jgi:hypothetical protein
MADPGTCRRSRLRRHRAIGNNRTENRPVVKRGVDDFLGRRPNRCLARRRTRPQTLQDPRNARHLRPRPRIQVGCCCEGENLQAPPGPTLRTLYTAGPSVAGATAGSPDLRGLGEPPITTAADLASRLVARVVVSKLLPAPANGTDSDQGARQPLVAATAHLAFRAVGRVVGMEAHSPAAFRAEADGDGQSVVACPADVPRLRVDRMWGDESFPAPALRALADGLTQAPVAGLADLALRLVDRMKAVEPLLPAAFAARTYRFLLQRLLAFAAESEDRAGMATPESTAPARPGRRRTPRGRAIRDRLKTSPSLATKHVQICHHSKREYSGRRMVGDSSRAIDRRPVRAAAATGRDGSRRPSARLWPESP